MEGSYNKQIEVKTGIISDTKPAKEIIILPASKSVISILFANIIFYLSFILMMFGLISVVRSVQSQKLEMDGYKISEDFPWRMNTWYMAETNIQCSVSGQCA